MPEPFRQGLARRLQAAIDGAIERNDQKYGRQLATMLERGALMLRSVFGGKALWRMASVDKRTLQNDEDEMLKGLQFEARHDI